MYVDQPNATSDTLVLGNEEGGHTAAQKIPGSWGSPSNDSLPIPPPFAMATANSQAEKQDISVLCHTVAFQAPLAPGRKWSKVGSYLSTTSYYI